MPDEATPVETLADSTTPPAGTTDANTDVSKDSPAESESISLDEAKKLRSEAQSLRKRLKTFEEAQAKIAEAELTESQREKQRADALEAERDEARREAASIRMDNAIHVAVSDAKLNARDTRLLSQVVNRDALSIEDGKVVGIEAELKRLKAEYPTQFYSSTADGAAGGDSGAVVDFNTEIRRRAGRAA